MKNTIPKIIYVFWDGKMNTFVSSCFENIQRMNPKFKVILLSSKSISDKPINYEKLSVQAKSDWARVDAVSKTGGVWIDISCIVLKPFESWIDFDSDTFHAFEVPFGCDVIESWAFAAPKNCPLVHAWKNEFKQAIEKGFEIYNNENDAPKCLKSWLPYLTIHQALHIAREKISHKNLKILKSTATNMPFYEVSKCKWDNSCFVNTLKNAPKLDSIFIKLTGSMNIAINKVGVRRMNIIELLRKKKYSHVERVLGIRIGYRELSTKINILVLGIILTFIIIFIMKKLSIIN